MERTGHRSVTGVRAYKRTSDVHIENCSAILDGKVMRQLPVNSTDSEHDSLQRARSESQVQYFMQNCNVTVNHFNTSLAFRSVSFVS